MRQLVNILSSSLLIESEEQIGPFARVGHPSPSLWNESQFTGFEILIFLRSILDLRPTESILFQDITNLEALSVKIPFQSEV